MEQFPRALRYSPVNWLIVDWGFNGVAFNDCGLPDPSPCSDDSPTSQQAGCNPLPIQDAIDTYDWERWLPEIMVGIEEPDPEIAANYAREAAIMFAKRARVLQRQVAIRLQPEVCTYPVEPYDGEQIVGAIGIATEETGACGCSDGCRAFMPNGIDFTLDVARNEIHLEGDLGACCSKPSVLKVLVWSAPTEDACEHDVFLYDHYRREITLEARRAYVLALHFRDKELLRVLPSRAEFERSIRLAKTHSMQAHSWDKTRAGSGMWSPACAGSNRACLRPR